MSKDINNSLDENFNENKSQNSHEDDFSDDFNSDNINKILSEYDDLITALRKIQKSLNDKLNY